jgi:ankyrin repeat protein
MEEEWFDAIIKNDIKKVKKLINQGYDINTPKGIHPVNIQNNYDNTALIIASRNGYKEIVELLLDCKYIDINTPKGIHPVNIKNNYDTTALIVASRNGNIDIVKLLLKQPGIDINLQDNYGFTALIYASRNEYIDIVKLLLKQPEIDVELKDNKNYFIDYKINDNSFLIDYDLQKQILNNQREDIIIFINQYELIHPDIKSEYKDLFQASVWGLI